MYLYFAKKKYSLISSIPRIIPPFYFLASVVAMALLNTFAPVLVWLHRPWTYIGAGPIFLGFLLSFNSVILFRRLRTPLHPGMPAKVLITEGAYQYTRNPIYLGMVLILLGICLLFGSLSPLLVIPFFIWIIHTRFILREEKWMEEWFGQLIWNTRKEHRGGCKN